MLQQRSRLLRRERKSTRKLELGYLVSLHLSFMKVILLLFLLTSSVLPPSLKGKIMIDNTYELIIMNVKFDIHAHMHALYDYE